MRSNKAVYLDIHENLAEVFSAYHSHKKYAGNSTLCNIQPWFCYKKGKMTYC
jgi:hypothetical protein